MLANRIYGNEVEVGQGIVDSGIPREDIFLTSKLWNTDHPNVAAGLEKTLQSLGVDYLDLYVRALCYLYYVYTLHIASATLKHMELTLHS